MTNDSEIKTRISTENLAKGLKLARELSGKSIKESSQLLGLPTSKLRNYEEGKYIPSLPEIESLSFFYNIPLAAIFEPDMIPQFINDPNIDQLKNLLKIRSQFIATHLQINREKSGKSYKQISKETSISTSRLKKFENGENDIPLDELEKFASSIGLKIEDVLDKESPIGHWQTSQKQTQAFTQLPEEIQVFALSKDNQPFISFINKVKVIGIENLAKLSDSIQQIISASNENQD